MFYLYKKSISRKSTEIPIEKFRSHVLSSSTVTVAICPAAARQSELPLKDFFNLLDSIWCFLRNVERFQKFCSFASYLGHRLHRQLEIFIELRPTASFKFNEKKRCIFRIAKRFYKLLWICFGRIRLSVRKCRKVSSKRTENIWCLFGTNKRL